ncbi:MAG: ParB/RepB/Spo0J family partition protein, partial [Desulfobacterales bacterium]|nr:ParB/RepB/Spo0J family partition protein [Desulfobacterales bacterium]
MSKKRLGKGLDALLPNDNIVIDSNQSKIIEISIDDIEPNPYQPRKEFDQEQLIELSQSIKEHGLIQPISVKKIGSKYQLIAGERRLRASKIANLKTISAIVKDYDEKQMMEIALIENIQREDLNPIEEAIAYAKLIEQFNLTQEEVSARVSKSRSAIANTIRLLNL